MSYSYMKYRWEKDFEVRTDPANVARTTKNALIGTTAPNKAVLIKAWRIYLDGMSGADVVWVDNASDNEIHGGTGSDTVYLSGTAKYNYVDGGNGNDHIVIQAPSDGRSNRNMILGGGNKDTFILQATDIANKPTTFTPLPRRNGTYMPVSERKPPDETTIGDYQYADDIIQLKTVTSDRSYAIDLSNRDAVNDAFDTDGRLTVSLGFYDGGSYSTRTATVLLRNSSQNPSCYKAVIRQTAADNDDFTSAKSKTSYVWWAKESSTTLNASSDSHHLIMVGSNNGDVGDKITGGAKADTIYAGSSDTVDGGRGNDSIDLTGATGVHVNLSRGTDSVKGFRGGFADESDVVDVAGAQMDAIRTSISGSDLKVFTSSNALLLQNAENADLGGAGTMKGFLLSLSGGEAKKYASVEKNATGIVLDDEIAEYYRGEDSALDASNLHGDITVDLGNTGKYGDTSVTYKGITAVKGTNHGSNLLVGAANAKDTLTGGTGAGVQNSLYGGGAAADIMEGGAFARDLFLFGTGDGKDTIWNCDASEDVIVFGKGTPTLAARDTSGNVKLAWNDSDVLTLSGMGTEINSTMLFSTDLGATSSGFRVGLENSKNTFTYAEDVSVYWGGKKGDTLAFSGAKDANVWLDGSNSVLYVGIHTLDAAESSGQLVLVGSTDKDTIIGGNGRNSLWGGTGVSDDVLTGGSGYNEFRFSKGEGHDVITSSNNADKVMLYNVNSADLNMGATGVNASGDLVISLLDGSSLTLRNYTAQGAETFQLADAAYRYDRASGTWNPQA